MAVYRPSKAQTMLHKNHIGEPVLVFIGLVHALRAVILQERGEGLVCWRPPVSIIRLNHVSLATYCNKIKETPVRSRRTTH